MMVKVTAYPDNTEFEVTTDETLLEAGLRSDIAFAHACGGRAKCSTCRIWIEDGLKYCSERTEDEHLMAERLGLSEEVRLACQLKPQGDLTVRRLVLDETDLIMCSQLDRAVATRTGEAKKVTIFFSDIIDFTSISQRLPPYDVMYLLNRFFVEVGGIVERNGGFIDKFVGDGLMTIFGINDRTDAPLRGINTALETLEAADRVKPFFASMYGVEFDIRIGLQYGEVVIGSLGSIGQERLTAIGDAVNVASRIEAANKEAGTRLLISEALYNEVEEHVAVADFVRVRLRGTEERITLYEVEALKPSAKAVLSAEGSCETMLHGGKTWTRTFGEHELDIGERRILAFGDLDVVVLRLTDGYHAFNNACPHMHLPLYERRDLPEGGIGCFPGTDTP